MLYLEYHWRVFMTQSLTGRNNSSVLGGDIV